MSKPWHDQELGCTMSEFLVRFRQRVLFDLIRYGRFNAEDLDHNSANYNHVVKISNKQVKIVASVLKDAPVEDYSIALATVIEAVFGPVYR